MKFFIIGAAVMGLGTPMSSPAFSQNAQHEAEDAIAQQAVVEQFYDAFGTGDMATIAALLSDDVEWVEAEGGPYDADNPYIGLVELGSGVFGPIAEVYGDFAATPLRFISQDNRVVVEGRYTGTHGETGELLDAQFVHVFTVEGERILAMQQYTDTYQWRRLAGTLND